MIIEIDEQKKKSFDIIQHPLVKKKLNKLKIETF